MTVLPVLAPVLAAAGSLGDAFRARDRAQVEASWHAGVDAGYRDGGFVLDPDGNSAEALNHNRG